jgi:hypothetical protein
MLCSTDEREEKGIQNFAGKPDGQRPLKRKRHRLKDNIKLDLK